MEEKKLYYYVLDGDDCPLYFETTEQFLEYISESEDDEYSVGCRKMTPSEFRQFGAEETWEN